MHIFGMEMVSYSEGSLDFERTVMADGFEVLAGMVGNGIRDLYLDSFNEWDEEMSRRVSDHFHSIERLEIWGVSMCGVSECLSRLVGRMAKLERLYLHHVTSNIWQVFDSEPNYSTTRTKAQDNEAAAAVRPGRHLHTLGVSTIQGSPDVLSFLIGHTLDTSHVEKLKLCWGFTHRAPLDTIHSFLTNLGPQITCLTMATPVQNVDEYRGMDVEMCLGDIISTKALSYFPSMRKLTLCAYSGTSINDSVSDDLCHKEKVALCHAFTLLDSWEEAPQLEELTIKLIPEGSRRPAQLPLWFRLRNLLASDKFAKLRKSCIRFEGEDEEKILLSSIHR
ncbi:hypothetical protein Moror_11311 [Moniliophthora roreri MCA 2997]|uniref:F-box domain-containing protein n=1 Tax=Moniliophthora roreri (strain MCA 2997) TaxID=1381753 RepID=V2WXN7_MONRO|nr:hypothetical protein Moror_11311 [Moniliophthora roreri MCA 2997]